MFSFLKKKISAFTKSATKTITERKISEKDLQQLFEELEVGLLESDVALEVVERLKEDLKKELIGKEVKRTKVKNTIRETFKKSLLDILDVPEVDLKEVAKKSRKGDKPTLFVFLGFNGSGKTTSLAKCGNWLMNRKFSCVFAAGDSWRSAAIEQLQEHGDKLGVKVIKHKYGADPAAVIFDSVKHAENKRIDIVLADTAGRSHVNKNLMDELKKICRVNKPDLKILVLDSLTGNDIINQCRMFDEAVGVDALIMTKADVADKGGSILTAAYVLKKPILFLGTGQRYKDLEKYDKEKIVEMLL